MVNYRLTETMESRIHRKVYVRFGGEYPETRHRNMKMGVGYLAYINVKDGSHIRQSVELCYYMSKWGLPKSESRGKRL